MTRYRANSQSVIWAWGGGGRPPPQYLAQTIVKVGFEAPQYLRQKGPKMILEVWAPPKILDKKGLKRFWEGAPPPPKLRA